MLLPLMADWIGRLHDEDTTEKDANDVIKSGIADNVFGIIANITVRDALPGVRTCVVDAATRHRGEAQ